MSEVGVEIVKINETEENEIKYLNINVSDSEVRRNPDVVRLHSDAGDLEYVKQDCKLNEVLDKIKAEIKALSKTYPFVNHIDAYVKVVDVLQIIDKYNNKKEVNE